MSQFFSYLKAIKWDWKVRRCLRHMRLDNKDKSITKEKRVLLDFSKSVRTELIEENVTLHPIN